VSADSFDQVRFPLGEFLGLTINQGEPSSGRADVGLEVGDNHLNPHGMAHGAVAFAMMDTAMGAAVMTIVPEGHLCATIEVHTRFHRPVRPGPLVAEAKVLTPGRRVVQLEARTTDAEGRLVASATSSFAVFEPRAVAGDED
jgi:acyl-CoA thioesterase